jgi:hypothetical protein
MATSSIELSSCFFIVGQRAFAAHCFLLALFCIVGIISSAAGAASAGNWQHSHHGERSTEHIVPHSIDEDLSEEELLAADDDIVGQIEEREQGLYVVPLRRESTPVYRRGKIVSFKTAYSGVISLGAPAQLFNVVFDTGSGHLVVPALECEDPACLVHERYSIRNSSTSVSVNPDGDLIAYGHGEVITIGYGTGEITGEFVNDLVCLTGQNRVEFAKAEGGIEAPVKQIGCERFHFIIATTMTTNPFKTLGFDGIAGLGLPPLGMNEGCNFVNALTRHSPHQQFAAFLTDGEHGEESEIVFGGYKANRALEEFRWSSVIMRSQGFWMLQVVSVRLDGREIDLCKDKSCRAIVDTGSSHVGIPKAAFTGLSEGLTRDANDLFDCRLVEGGILEIELGDGINVKLFPRNYMRRLPLRTDISVSGVAIGQSPPSTPSTSTSTTSNETETEEKVPRRCVPRFVSVALSAPVGPNLFILGEPALHRYYTVFDTLKQRVGFALANNRLNKEGIDSIRGEDGRGVLPDSVEAF